MDLSIVIVNYNTWHYTIAAIRSVLQYTHGITYEIILVDNASESFDAVTFQKEFPGVTLVLNPTNQGFAGGNNTGIAHASGDYILLLNSDTYLKDNALPLMLRFMQENPDAGAMSPRLVYPDGRHQSVAQRFPSVKYQLIELLRIQKLTGRKRGGRILLGAFFDHKKTIKADWVWAAALLIPRQVIRKLPEGKLDEHYFMYWEDVQWCMDIRKLGYQIYFYPGAEIVHLHGGSNAGKSALIEQNEAKFLQRNYSSLHIRWIKKLEKWLGKK